MTKSQVSQSQASPTLLLVPTEIERGRLETIGGIDATVCGFGPVAAAARTAHLLETVRPARVVLLGIAGTYNAARCAVGSAFCFGEAAIDGVGVGAADRFVTAQKIGFSQTLEAANRVGPADQLALFCPEGATAVSQILTVCAASATPDEARRRQLSYPNAAAEDMEAFGVALACGYADIPVAVVRGISNVAGDRDIEHWRIDEALREALALCRTILNTSWASSREETS